MWQDEIGSEKQTGVVETSSVIFFFESQRAEVVVLPETSKVFSVTIVLLGRQWLVSFCGWDQMSIGELLRSQEYARSR